MAKNEKNAPEPASSPYTNRQKGTTKDIYEQSRDQHFNKESKTEIAYDIGKSAIKLAEASIKYNKEKGNEEEVLKKEKELAEKRIKISAEILKLNEEEIFHLENGLPEVIKEVETAFNKIDEALITSKNGGLRRGNFGLGKDAENVLSSTVDKDELKALHTKYGAMLEYFKDKEQLAQNAQKYSDEILTMSTPDLNEKKETTNKHVEPEQQGLNDSTEIKKNIHFDANQVIFDNEEEFQQSLSELREAEAEQRKQKQQENINDSVEQHEEHHEEIEELQEDSQGEQLDILDSSNDDLEQSEADSHKTRIAQWQEYAEKVSAISQQVSEITSMVTNSLGGMFSQLSASYAQELESLNEKIAAVDEEKEAALERVALTEDQRRAREEELAQQKINLEYATSEEQKNKADERIATLQGELGAEDSINRDFESKKASLEKEKEKKEKAQKKAEKMQKRLEMGQAIVEAIGNIAQGAAKALSMGPILGPILAAIVSAAGAIQVGVMTKQLAKMEDGGLLRGKRHSAGGMRIQGSNIEVEGGEYVVNRQSTDKNLGLLGYINSQHRELGSNDLHTFFSTPFPRFQQPAYASMFEKGGQVPMLPMPADVDTQILRAIESINFQPQVSVTDINTIQQNMVRVDEWTGL